MKPLLLLALASTALADFAVVENADRVVITHGGAAVAEYIFDDPAVHRPFFAHVHAPGGAQVTRRFPPIAGQDATDHADMHPGIWLGFGDIGGHDFWRNKARIRHERFTESPAVRDEVVRFATASTMLSPGGEVLAQLDTRIIVTAHRSGWLLTWDATFIPAGDGFYFGDQEEMGFGARVATPLAEKNGGEIVNSNGIKGAKATWGQPAAWCDYSGTIDGQRAGIALFPSPRNFRPSWWHNRDYGVFVANPFGRKAMKQGEASRVEVRRGESFTLRFGAFIHAAPADVATAYAAFCAQP